MLKCYYDTSDMPIAIALRSRWKEIKAEADQLFITEGDNPKVNAVMRGQDGRNLPSIGVNKYDGRVDSLHLRVVPELLDGPEAALANIRFSVDKRMRMCENCPVTLSVLAPYMEHIGNVGFNRLYPGGVINPHYGNEGSDTYIRLHLGLRTDPDAKFYGTDVEPYAWTEGGTMAFDDATLLHWVRHDGSNMRMILTIDVKKDSIPGLRAI